MANEEVTLSTVHQFVGKELGATDWLTIEQERIDLFAECSDDHQWIHCDPQLAEKDSPFGCTVAHGYLTLSLVTKFQGDLGVYPVDAKQMLNYGVNKVRFLQPVRVGDRVRDRVTLQSVEVKDSGACLLTLANVIEIEGSSTPAMVAEILALAS